MEIEKDTDIDLKEREVLIVEDIVDTGLTLNFLTRELEKRFPKGVKVCTFLNCPARRIVEVPVHYCCFEIPDVYVVGYGLDFQGISVTYLKFILCMTPAVEAPRF